MSNLTRHPSHISSHSHQSGLLSPSQLSHYYQLLQHSSLLLSSTVYSSHSSLSLGDQLHLVTSTLPLVTAYLSLVLLSSCDSTVSYYHLYPPGWCLVTSLEKR